MNEPVIFLDVMGTLVRDPFYEEIPAFFGLTLAEFIQAKHPTAWVEFEHGRLSEAEYLSRMFPDQRVFDTEALLNTIKSSYRWLDGVEPLLVDLRNRGAGMHAMSNYPVWYQYIEEKLELSRFLRWTFVSCLAGVRKPRREAFLAAAGAVGKTPDQCLLIDDVRENCVAAEATGMQAILFTDASAARGTVALRSTLGAGRSTRIKPGGSDLAATTVELRREKLCTSDLNQSISPLIASGA